MRVPNAAKLAAVLAIGIAVAVACPVATPGPLPDIPAASRDVALPHLPFGPVNPRKPAPDVALAMHDGAADSLARPNRKTWRLAQIIFTNCATTCPLQGAIFRRTQQLLEEGGLDAEMLSISVDPDHDDANALRAWLSTFEAGPNWRAAVVAKNDVGAVLDFFNGRKSGLDVHDARVYFIDPQGRLAYATEDLPDPTALVALLRQALANDGAPPAPEDQALRSQ